ncbi:S-layer homology domain-containing protein [Sporomusa acidovorans]|uniref:SLH domain-containing protein n=1 Tax=Sporomusa acidovorans (strain ATCC 49682 / DSM 3132 / Mol) TaxID=1123286 RepID=A0ABZ3J765_SPOA4|nr:S-layer homology domain-containing protein [Sporomusa acidovorans]OZC19312.1 outer membrane protein alpha precursor [Sporomusa acidovorans DSM 3132]SDD81123.1 S-layer homology domain-containing protein [Sporomusa acidovorans]
MNKRLLKVAVTTALTVAFAVPAFANPFTDVPAKHWAYDAVNKLAQAGVVTGYGDGTFKGDKTVSRYEMASIIATAMQKNLNSDQKATVDKLSKEFAAELNSMGIKVDALDKKVDNMVKISGDARVRYFAADDAKDNEDYADYRARVSFDGKINDNMKFNARLSSGSALSEDKGPGISLETANVSFNALGLNNTIGRQDIKLGSGYLLDGQMNGIATKAGGLKLFAGNASSNAKVNDSASPYANGVTTLTTTPATVWNKVYGAEYGTNILGAQVTADYLKNNTSKDEFIGANVGFKLFNGVTANAEYFQNSGDNKNDATAKAYGVKLNNLGLSATYRDVEANAVTPFSTMFTSTNTQFADLNGGFKGMEYQFDKALDKNATLTVKYQDFETQDGAKLPARTSAAVNVKF